MSANAVSGPHGRDIGPSEATRPAQNPLPSFHDVLSALNPLQYLPVVGTIYRAVTGDQGSPQLRVASSLATGFVTGGPIGLLTSLAGIVADHFLHFDRIAASLFGDTPVAPGAPVAVAGSVPASAASGTASLAASAVSAYARASNLAPTG